MQGCFTADGLRFSNQEDLDRHPHVMEVTGDDEAVAAVISASTKDSHMPCPEVGIFLAYHAHHLGPSIFHQHLPREAIGLDRQAIKGTHFCGSSHPHNTSPLWPF